MLNNSSLPAIAERLVITREAMGLSQAEFCRQAGIAANSYNQYEKGKRRLNLDAGLRMCERFGYTLDWIYRGTLDGLPSGLAERIRPLVA